MKGRRSLAVLALAAPLALTAVATAPPAMADGSFTSPTPSEGAVLSSNSFTVRASVAARSDTVTLTVTSQDSLGGSCTTSTSGRGGLSSSTTLTLTIPNSACSTTRNARWTATLSGDASVTRTFSTNAAPTTPGNFSADGDGARDVAFQWTRGSEPDLTGFALFDGAGNVIDGDISLARCNGSTCTYALYYLADNPGTHQYSLAAKRQSAGCSTCGTEVQSAKATDSATLVEPPPPPPPPPTPTPTPTPTGGTTTGGSTTGGSTTGGSTTGGSTTGGSTTGGSTTGGSTTGGTAVKPAPKPTVPSLPSRQAAARRAFALNFNAFSPSLGIPKLPPLPANFAPTLSPEAPLPMGTYAPTLPYKAQTETVENTSVVYKYKDGVDVTKVEELVPAIAIALILLLMAAHLRRFLGLREDG